MQFDVYRNPIPKARRAFPFVAVLQSDLAETGRDTVVAFLAPKPHFPAMNGRLMPEVTIDGQACLLLTPSLTNLPTAELSQRVDTVAAHRDAIVRALDWLFLGV